MAEGVFRHLSDLRGAGELFEVVSAGTVCYQAGSCPDPRAVRAAGRLGIDISGIRAQCIHDLDMAGFDHVFAMDYENYRDVLDAQYGSARQGVHMVTEYAGEAGCIEVEDPYYGPEEGFDRTLETLLGCADGILTCLLADYGLSETIEHGSNDSTA
jgi:protein-tyrosine phosphatase